jgi:hypothetical protein
MSTSVLILQMLQTQQRWMGSSVVEQEPFKLLVVGSIPTPFTTYLFFSICQFIFNYNFAAKQDEHLFRLAIEVMIIQ